MFMCVCVFAWLQSKVHVNDVIRKELTDLIAFAYTWTEITLITLIVKKGYKEILVFGT